MPYVAANKTYVPPNSLKHMETLPIYATMPRQPMVQNSSLCGIPSGCTSSACSGSGGSIPMNDPSVYYIVQNAQIAQQNMMSVSHSVPTSHADVSPENTRGSVNSSRNASPSLIHAVLVPQKQGDDGAFEKENSDPLSETSEKENHGSAVSGSSPVVTAGMPLSASPVITPSPRSRSSSVHSRSAHELEKDSSLSGALSGAVSDCTVPQFYVIPTSQIHPSVISQQPRLNGYPLLSSTQVAGGAVRISPTGAFPMYPSLSGQPLAGQPIPLQAVSVPYVSTVPEVEISDSTHLSSSSTSTSTKHMSSTKKSSPTQLTTTIHTIKTESMDSESCKESCKESKRDCCSSAQEEMADDASCSQNRSRSGSVVSSPPFKVHQLVGEYDPAESLSSSEITPQRANSVDNPSTSAAFDDETHVNHLSLKRQRSDISTDAESKSCCLSSTAFSLSPDKLSPNPTSSRGLYALAMVAEGAFSAQGTPQPFSSSLSVDNLPTLINTRNDSVEPTSTVSGLSEKIMQVKEKAINITPTLVTNESVLSDSLATCSSVSSCEKKPRTKEGVGSMNEKDSNYSPLHLMDDRLTELGNSHKAVSSTPFVCTTTTNSNSSASPFKASVQTSPSMSTSPPVDQHKTQDQRVNQGYLIPPQQYLRPVVPPMMFLGPYNELYPHPQLVMAPLQKPQWISPMVRPINTGSSTSQEPHKLVPVGLYHAPPPSHQQASSTGEVLQTVPVYPKEYELNPQIQRIDNTDYYVFPQMSSQRQQPLALTPQPTLHSALPSANVLNGSGYTFVPSPLPPNSINSLQQLNGNYVKICNPTTVDATATPMQASMNPSTATTVYQANIAECPPVALDWAWEYIPIGI